MNITFIAIIYNAGLAGINILYIYNIYNNPSEN